MPEEPKVRKLSEVRPAREGLNLPHDASPRQVLDFAATITAAVLFGPQNPAMATRIEDAYIELYKHSRPAAGPNVVPAPDGGN